MSASARHAGVAEIIVTDVARAPLELAESLGANGAYDSSQSAALGELTNGGGEMDLTLECSAQPAAIADAIAATGPCGTIVQVGMLGTETTAPLTHVVTKELNFRGTFRFDVEFPQAVRLIAERHIDVRPLISRRFPLAEAEAAFAMAQDHGRAMKVLFDLN
ncbi:zinc-binding dehydrogenase [Paracoccus saliphilus]|uniref:zinc-binding dehydrogenase n=1 Tax=Paracoccus saliphilus TaxID=405559 RepID=UPI0009713523|nr:zinc-binding dehydrogenase [Paracoccus saliphilus]